MAANKQNATVLRTIGNRYQIKDEIDHAYKDQSKLTFGFILLDLHAKKYSVITQVLDIPIVYFKE